MIPTYGMYIIAKRRELIIVPLNETFLRTISTFFMGTLVILLLGEAVKGNRLFWLHSVPRNIHLFTR